MLRFSIKSFQLVYKASFLQFAKIVTKIEMTPSLNEKKQIMSSYISNSTEKDQETIAKILQFVNQKPKTGLATKSLLGFLQNKYFPDSELVETDIDSLIDGLRDTEEFPNSDVKLEEVYSTLQLVMTTKGKGSIQNKLDLIDLMLDRMTLIQVKTAMRILNKKLRIGLTGKSFIFQTSSQTKSQKSTAEQQVIQQKMTLPNFQPMLSMPLKSIEDVWKFCSKKSEVSKQLLADLKYDGERTLIIYQRGKGLQLMSRRQKSQTENYKSFHSVLLSELDKIPELKSIQIDGQILCVSGQGEHLPQQTLLTKRGKENHEDQFSKLSVFAFDVVELNGQSLMNKPLKQRRTHIPTTGHIQPSEHILFEYPEEKNLLVDYYKLAIDKRREGLIIKGTNDLYFSNGSRRHWGKFKKGCKIMGEDTGEIDLDLVVMGVYFGKGKNSQRFSAFLLGVYHENKLHPVSKVGTGFNEVQLDQFTKIFSELAVQTRPNNYQIPKALIVDQFVQPVHVFKVSCQDLTRSPHYKLNYEQGIGGISLRFPVFQQIRDDKSPQSCTSADLLLYLDMEDNN